jgi:hypothetical protein
MKRIATTAVATLLALFDVTALARDIRMVGVAFERGAETAQITDEVKADEPVMYRFRAATGQDFAFVLSPKNRNVDLILYAPGKWPGTELHNSAAAGRLQYAGQVGRDGVHAVLVSRSAGRAAGEPAGFDLTITLKKAAQ